MSEVVLTLWTVYERPADYPEGFVARRHEVLRDETTRPTPDAVFGATIGDVRAKIPRIFGTCVPRSPGDKPQIVESWL